MEFQSATTSAIFYFQNVIPSDYCKIILSSYVNMLAHAVVLESSEIHHEHREIPDVSKFIKPNEKSWENDPLIKKAFEINLISFYNGKGKGTQFCFNPEKDQLIYGNYKIYEIFSNVIYRDPFLCIQPSGFLVLPQFSYDTVPWVQKNFLEYCRNGPNTYAGIVVIESDDDFVFSHCVESLDGILDHVELLRAFFDPIKGHPSHRVVFSSSRSPFVLPKTFDVDIYNQFREIYNEMYEDSSLYSNYLHKNIYVAFCREILSSISKPKPVLSKLEWVKHYLRKGSVFIWHDCLPYRFRCFRALSVNDLFQSSNQENPLVCVELTYLPARNQTSIEVKGDVVAFTTRTVSPNPIRHSSFVKKFGNRFEKQVVRLMTTNSPYQSPFSVEGDYWTSVANPLFFALKGIDNDSKPFLWTDYAKKLSEMNK